MSLYVVAVNTHAWIVFGDFISVSPGEERAINGMLDGCSHASHYAYVLSPAMLRESQRIINLPYSKERIAL